MDKQELVAKLRRIDENAFFSNPQGWDRKASVLLVGSSVLLLCDLSSKGTTKDVDVLRAESSIRPFLFDDMDFNSQCRTYELCLPYNFEDRVVPIELNFRTFALFAPSLEDLAVMKLYRWEDPDKADLTSPSFLERLDWTLLDFLVHSPEEAAASRCAPPERDREYKNLLHNYTQYESGWRK